MNSVSGSESIFSVLFMITMIHRINLNPADDVHFLMQYFPLFFLLYCRLKVNFIPVRIMPSSRAIFVMVSISILFTSVLSHYREGAIENDGDFDELKNEVIGGEWKTGSDDDAYSSYPAESIKQILLRNDPQLFFVTSMQRRDDAVSTYIITLKGLFSSFASLVV